jgi:NTE family protein
VSTCRAFGAEITIAVNLNGDLVRRRGAGWGVPQDMQAPTEEKAEAFNRFARGIPDALRGQVVRLVARLLRPGPPTPGYFDVPANAVNIMQDRITRSRLAGEPPDVLLQPRLADFNLMDFTRAKEAAAKGRRCAHEFLPAIRKLL